MLQTLKSLGIRTQQERISERRHLVPLIWLCRRKLESSFVKLLLVLPISNKHNLPEQKMSRSMFFLSRAVEAFL